MGGSSKKKLGKRIGIRIFADITFVLALLFMPWQVLFVLGIFGTFFFPYFIEVIIVGVLFDMLYAPVGVEFTVLAGTIFGVLAYGSIEYAKIYLRGY